MVLIPGCILTALPGELLSKPSGLGLPPRDSDSVDLWVGVLGIQYFFKGCLVNLSATIVENYQ